MTARLFYGFRAWLERRAGMVVVFVCLASAGAAYYAATHIAVNTNTADMFDSKLPWRQNYIRFREEFPELIANVLVVIDSDVAEFTDAAQRRLADRLRADEVTFKSVLALETSNFIVTNGLLYMPVAELDETVTRVANIQPIIGRLQQQPHLAGFFSLLVEAVEGDAPRTPQMTEVFTSLTAVFEDPRKVLSWGSIVVGPHAATGGSVRGTGEGGARRVIVVAPHLDFSKAEPRADAIQKIRDVAEDLGLVPANGYTVRLTGPLALQAEELASVASGMVEGAALTFVLVVGVLMVGLRSWVLVVACVVTLVAGLSFTALFVALAVGHLNLISVAFAVLYIGLGIDFGIHFCLRFSELRQSGVAHHEAVNQTCADIGRSLAVCAVTTSIGFYAFVPTLFTGMSELGLISGTGMYFSLAVSLVLLPALLHVLPAATTREMPKWRVMTAVGAVATGRRGVVRGAALLIAGGGLWAALGAQFDSNPLLLRDPQSESVATFVDLMGETATVPTTVSVLVDVRDEEVVRRLESDSAIAEVRRLDDFVPNDQRDKLELIDELALIVGDRTQFVLAPADTERDLDALRDVGNVLAGSGVAGDRSLADAIELWLTGAAALEQNELAAQLSDLSRRLLATLALRWNQLVRGLDAAPISKSELPEGLTRMWVTAGGAERLEVVPAMSLDTSASLETFVERVISVVPVATGAPVVEYLSGKTLVDAFFQAFATALAGVTVVMLVLLRDPPKTAAIVAALLLAAILTCAATVALDLPFNFANVITLPLLLGVGVDHGIHLVHRLRTSKVQDLLQTATARAIFFSTLTTICSFGTLAFSSHPGTASMGVLLTMGMLLTLVCALFLIPALVPETPRGDALEGS
ncbi:MAG: MMPL family transporter [Gammaproteobacteria bacterium]|nr:MMPL family transporter [Gammaproteobacteria bacterium]